MLEIIVLILVAIQLAVFAALAVLLRRTRPPQKPRRDQQWEALIDELRLLTSKVTAARAESATYLQAVFTGVQGLARNLDAERRTSQEALRTFERVQSAVAERDAEARAQPAPVPDTSPDLSPAPTLMEPRPRLVGVPRRRR